MAVPVTGPVKCPAKSVEVILPNPVPTPPVIVAVPSVNVVPVIVALAVTSPVTPSVTTVPSSFLTNKVFVVPVYSNLTLASAVLERISKNPMSTSALAFIT